jgi:hypothetical protein
MKKIIGIWVMMLFATSSIIACDVCGSGSGNTYLGLLPGFQKKFMGLRYQHNSLQQHLGPNGERTYLSTRERFHTVEYWGAVNIGSRFRVSAFVPYLWAEKEQSGTRLRTSGPGDISIVGYARVLENAKEGKLQQQAWLGAGVKLPTGKYDENEPNLLQGASNSFQLGSASLDFMLHALYDIRYRNLGLNTNISYRINNVNRYDYKYGNKWVMNYQAYYVWQKGNAILKPHLGLLYETASRDQNDGHLPVWQSGGNIGLGTTGLELSLGKIGFSLNYQQVLWQNLAAGRLKAGNRLMLGINLLW